MVLGAEATYKVTDALCASVASTCKAYGPEEAPFESVRLVNRYYADVAHLETSGAPADKCFGSVTDLTTGRERPVDLVAVDGKAILEQASCPPRQLLRIYWPVV
jgi:hypothetical protein